jgi:hypothetical protein
MESKVKSKKEQRSNQERRRGYVHPAEGTTRAVRKVGDRRRAKAPEEKFNFVVGYYWANQANGDTEISTYSFGRDVFYGTMKDAENYLKFVKIQEKDRPKEARHDYKIFKLVEVK